MKNKIYIFLLAAAALLAILFTPIPQPAYDDGGTREYIALTYKIVDWNRIYDDGVYEKTKVYFGSDRSESVDTLWEREAENIHHSFKAKLILLDNTTARVQPLDGQPETLSCDRFSFSIAELAPIQPQLGDILTITYQGGIMESYPAQIKATAWEISKDQRPLDYTGIWMGKGPAQLVDNNFFGDIIITEIYANCFFAETVIPTPYKILIWGQLDAQWCVGDQVICTYEYTGYDPKTHHVEASLLTIVASDWEPDPFVAYKPVIYLYPQELTDAYVTLELDGKLTCTYPEYHDGWHITAAPDGTLTDKKGQTYNYLYWEGETNARWDLSKGFCVKGTDTAVFLESALEKLGLNRREANEFIVYWLPLMEGNPYNIISFQQEVYTDAAKLTVSPAPDTMIRVFMAWRGADHFVDIPAQELTAPVREGFTVVEWGGTQIK